MKNQIISNAQFKKLLLNVNNTKHKVILYLSYLSLRIREIGESKISDYNSKGKYLYVRRKKQTIKSKVYLNTEVCDIIDTLKLDSKYLLGEKISGQTAARIIASYSSIVNLHLNGNLLRKSGLTEIARISNDTVAKEQAGHSNLNTTKTHYIKGGKSKSYQAVLEKL